MSKKIILTFKGKAKDFKLENLCVYEEVENG